MNSVDRRFDNLRFLMIRNGYLKSFMFETDLGDIPSFSGGYRRIFMFRTVLPLSTTSLLWPPLLLTEFGL
jgi:hypothetical protein